MIYYQGLAREALGQKKAAQAIFQKLIDYGREHSEDRVTMDYFAVSLPDMLVFEDDLTVRNRIHCLYIQGLGLLGLKDAAAAQKQFAQITALDANHSGVIIHALLA